MRLPVVLQSERAECGLACLAMIAGYYGYHVSIRELRVRFRFSIRGTSLRHLRECAEQIRLKCRAVRIELMELDKLRSPAILHWELDHFVVLKSVDRQGITIVDPALGVRRLSLKETNLRFTGVALELTPTPTFEKKETPDTAKLSSFLSALKGLGGPLSAMFCMTVLLQIFALVMPLNMQFTVDQGIRQGDMNIVIALAAAFGLIALTSAFTAYFRSLLLLYVSNSAALRMVGGLTHHLLRLPDSWLTARHTGDVLSRFSSVSPISSFLIGGAFGILLDAVMAIGALVLLILYSWQMTLVLCLFLALFAGLNAACYAPLKHLTQESIGAAALESSSFIENVQRHRVIKLLGAETDREHAWGERYVASINSSARLNRFGIHVALAGSVIGSVEGVTMLLLGASRVINGGFTLGMLFAFSAYSSMFSARVHSLITALVGFRMLKLHQERIADIALAEREVTEKQYGSQPQLRGTVSIHALKFAYNDEEEAVLENLDLEVAEGEFVAVMGESGSGKSTLIKILAKLLIPTSGEVRIDGQELSRLDTAHYRQQLGVIMQDDSLFSGSLFENIAAGDRHANPERVEQAAKLACIHEEIHRMPMQYQTLVGDIGSNLSGGQLQRIMIARAIYRQPKMLLLDEGTTYLNDRLQHQVLENLGGLGATLIVVTHDSRVAARADRCVRLEECLKH